MLKPLSLKIKQSFEKMIDYSGNQDLQQLIHRINTAKKLEEVLDTGDLKQQYRNTIRRLHPDLCSITEAVAALIKLNQLSDFTFGVDEAYCLW